MSDATIISPTIKRQLKLKNLNLSQLNSKRKLLENKCYVLHVPLDHIGFFMHMFLWLPV